jgi:hypothetical protein
VSVAGGSVGVAGTAVDVAVAVVVPTGVTEPAPCVGVAEAVGVGLDPTAGATSDPGATVGGTAVAVGGARVALGVAVPATAAFAWVEPEVRVPGTPWVGFGVAVQLGAGVTVGKDCAATRAVVNWRASVRTRRVGVAVGEAASPWPAATRASATPAARHENARTRGTAASLPAAPLAGKPASR